MILARDYEVVLLAAGCSRRLEHLTRDVPKAFLPVGERRIIDYALDSVEALGFERVTVVVGYLEEVYRRELGERRGNLCLRYVSSPDFATTGHGHSLFLTRGHILAEVRPVLLLHADVVFDRRILERVLASPHPDVLAVDDAFERRTNDEVLVHGTPERITAIRKIGDGPRVEGSVLGEVVGLNKWSPGFVRALFAFMERWFAERGRNWNWEPVVDAFLASPEAHARYVLRSLPIGKLGWVNVNHEDDLALAASVVGGAT